MFDIPKARAEELAKDLAEHGLRFDKNPTMPGFKDEMAIHTFYLNYIERMDKRAREIGKQIAQELK